MLTGHSATGAIGETGLSQAFARMAVSAGTDHSPLMTALIEVPCVRGAQCVDVTLLALQDARSKGRPRLEQRWTRLELPRSQVRVLLVPWPRVYVTCHVCHVSGTSGVSGSAGRGWSMPCSKIRCWVCRQAPHMRRGRISKSLGFRLVGCRCRRRRMPAGSNGNSHNAWGCGHVGIAHAVAFATFVLQR